MTNNKQSSVEWLMEIDKSRAITIEEWQQAKAMHKKEIKDAFNQGYRDGEHDYGNTTQILRDISAWDDSENYYNETFDNEQTN